MFKFWINIMFEEFIDMKLWDIMRLFLLKIKFNLFVYEEKDMFVYYSITFLDFSIILINIFFETFLIIFFLLLFLIVCTRVFGYKKFIFKEKNSIYECGFAVFGKVSGKFNVQFFFIALLFIIFDLEISFLYPMILIFFDLTFFEFFCFFIFLFFLFLGFFLEWYFGLLIW